jgi:hypothetical protein
MKNLLLLILVCSSLDGVFAEEKKEGNLSVKAKTRFQNIDLFNKVLYLIEKNYY